MLSLLLSGATVAYGRVLESSQSTGVWSRAERANPSTIIDVVVAMKHEPAALSQLESVFWEVSNPKHENYGKYLNVDQITDIVGLPQDKIDAVVSFLSNGGAKNVVVVPNKDAMTASLTVEAAELMFETTLFNFKHQRNQASIVRAADAYSVPDNMSELISVVGGMMEFPDINQVREFSSAHADIWPDACNGKCEGKITPAVLNKLYSINVNVSIAAKGSMAVAEFGSQFFDQADLDAFTQECDLPGIKVIEAGDRNKAKRCTGIFGNCVEALLDLEYIGGLAPNVPLTDIHSKSFSLLDWATSIAGDSSTPLVHSVSYGNDERQQDSVAYMNQCNVQFQKVGARGISILFATGDQGVWGRTGPGDRFNPDFPAGSPYITGVGGTDFSKRGYSTEVGCKDGGGGFSDTFPMPSFQRSAVQGYFQSGVTLPASQYYNSTGRGYPDIAANFGEVVPYCVVNKLSDIGVGGTSASCPVVAAMIALLNDIRLKAGKPALGFLNPFLYQTHASYPNAFTDITSGENKADGDFGFTATKGWDPVTGVGVPNFAELAKIVSTL
jgi:tripeptidyl-peptidase-1